MINMRIFQIWSQSWHIQNVLSLSLPLLKFGHSYDVHLSKKVDNWVRARVDGAFDDTLHQPSNAPEFVFLPNIQKKIKEIRELY